MKPLLAAMMIAAVAAASLPAPAHGQMSPSDRKKQEALDKAQKLKSEDAAYQAATQTMTTQDTAVDPWGNIRPGASAPAPKVGSKTGSKAASKPGR